MFISASVLAGQLQGRPSDSAASNLTSGFKCGGKGLLRAKKWEKEPQGEPGREQEGDVGTDTCAHRRGGR